MADATTGFENMSEEMLTKDRDATVARIHRATRVGGRRHLGEEQARYREISRELEQRRQERDNEAEDERLQRGTQARRTRRATTRVPSVRVGRPARDR